MKKRAQPKTWADVQKSRIRVVSEIKDISDDKSGTRIVYRASTGMVDRDLERIDPIGWVWNEAKLPAHIYCHRADVPENWLGKGVRVWKDATGLYYETLLFDQSPSAIADVARQVAWIARTHPDALSSSVGFIPLEWTDPDGRKFSIQNPGNSYPWSVPGRNYTRQELIEHSVAPVPSLIESLAVSVRSLLDAAGNEIEQEEEESAPVPLEPPAPEPASPAEPLIPTETEAEKAWRALGIEPPPAKTSGVVLSRAQFDRLKDMQGQLEGLLRSATPAESGSTSGA